MKALSFLLSFIIMLYGCASLKKADMIYYTDQNNNSFTITKDKIVYKAIKAVASSSGTYSGGADKRVKVSPSDFELLKKLAFEMIKDKTHHSKKREMMTSVILIQSKGENKQIVLYPSPQRTLFEKTLRKTTGLD